MLCRIAVVLGVLYVGLLAGGCATITRGSTQDVSISSTPAGASVFVDGEHKGITPTTVKMKRSNDHTVQISMEGHETITVQVKSSLGSAYVGNILCGGLIGLGVDALSGASYDLAPADIQAILPPIADGLTGPVPIEELEVYE